MSARETFLVRLISAKILGNFNKREKDRNYNQVCYIKSIEMH